ncbi:response regulator [Desulfogranum marinum]|uniref:response regulator n=1 Tax=Desulfogranum marinum TaxID=453220 RepID=UPI0029C71085|nr:response regulator [Desulfogranum marinum]
MSPSTILAVDDNPSTLHMLASILKSEQYHVLTAADGIEAMEALQQHGQNIDTILLDRMMPNMDGMEVTKQVLKNPTLKYIPIIMQTAADKPEEIIEGIKAGVFYYLTKPIERNMLLSIIASAIKETRQRKVLEAEMRRHKISFGLVDVLRGRCRTLDEAESMSSFLANCFPDAERALTGISELLFNAVEHGNLGISYEEKTDLINKNIWREEVERRLDLPEYAEKTITVFFEKRETTYYLQVTDQGKGFNWKDFMGFDASRASHNHGRGIAMAKIIAFDRLTYNDEGNQVTAVMKK